MNRREWCIRAPLSALSLLSGASFARGAWVPSGADSEQRAQFEARRQQLIMGLESGKAPERALWDITTIGDPEGKLSVALAAWLATTPAGFHWPCVMATCLAAGGERAVSAIAERLEQTKSGLTRLPTIQDLDFWPKALTYVAALGAIGPAAATAAPLLETWLTDAAVLPNYVPDIRLALANIRDEAPVERWKDLAVQRIVGGKRASIEVFRDSWGTFSVWPATSPRRWFGEALVRDSARLLSAEDNLRELLGLENAATLARALGVLGNRGQAAADALRRYSMAVFGEEWDYWKVIFALAETKVDEKMREAVLQTILNAPPPKPAAGPMEGLMEATIPAESCFLMMDEPMARALAAAVKSGARGVAIKAAELLVDGWFKSAPALEDLLDIACGDAERERIRLAMDVVGQIVTFPQVAVMQRRLEDVRSESARTWLSELIRAIQSDERPFRRKGELRWE